MLDTFSSKEGGHFFVEIFSAVVRSERFNRVPELIFEKGEEESG